MRTTRRPPKDPLDHDPDAVFEARKNARLTQQQVADLCGVSRSFIAEIELGTRNAADEMIDKLAAAFDCPRVILERKREPEAATAPTNHMPEPGLPRAERAEQPGVPELLQATEVGRSA